jgi:crotonobetainyl-CoA:carnitine CoA-transferase CaiB-like acyl-CoA transferase
MTAILAGVRVIDMTSVVMGPLATQILGDFGADVIKVEAPEGDTTRRVGPMRSPLMGWIYLHLNRNKRSLVLNLKQQAARDALLRLVERADVFVVSVRPAALERLGISYAALAAKNPRLIWVSLVGFGSGPYAGKPVYEDLIQGLTSVPSLLVRAGSAEPHYVPVSFNDRTVGVTAALAISMALLHRERTGAGQQIEVPMFETMAQHVLGDHLGGHSFEPPLGPPGYLRTLNAERRPYRTQDGHVCVIIYTDRHWASFLQLIGKGELMQTDPRLRDIGSRTVHSNELYGLISDQMPLRTTAQWLADLDAADIPAAPMHTLDSVLQDEHLLATGTLASAVHATEGPIRELRPAGQWSLTPPVIRRRAPRLGQDSVDVLREAGLSEKAIGQLIADGATTAVAAA